MSKKPDTSLSEDLKVLGLLSGDEAKALNEAEHADEKADKALMAKELAKADDKEDDKEAEKKDEKAAPKKVPAFLKDKEAEDEKAKEEMAYAEQCEAAWAVVRDYYKLSESEDKELTTEDLRTVIDAFAFIVEGLNSDKPTESPDALAHDAAEKLFDPAEDPVKDNAQKASPLGGKVYDKKYGKVGNQGSEKAASPYHLSKQVKTEGLDELVGELKALRNAFQESEAEPTAEQLAVSQKLIEGFEAVRDSAAEVAKRIGNELSESKDVKEDDSRVTAKTYFDGIAEDAAAILTAITEGKVEMSDALEDLNSISSDLHKGLEALSDVE